jgi:hypothetical protein
MGPGVDNRGGAEASTSTRTVLRVGSTVETVEITVVTVPTVPTVSGCRSRGGSTIGPTVPTRVGPRDYTQGWGG